MNVLYSDNHLLVVAKPACLPMVPDGSEDESLFEQAKAWIAREFGKPGKVFLGVVHRLDRPVSGVAVFARTSKSAARLTEQFRTRVAKKTYLGVTEGWPEPGSALMEQWLRKDPEQNRVTVRGPETEGAKRAVTEWKTLARRGAPGGGTALVELHPLTGRSHQLRVAMASAGAPLQGDLKYGASRALPDRSIALHALRLELEHPTRREPLVFECPPPKDRRWRRDEDSLR